MITCEHYACGGVMQPPLPPLVYLTNTDSTGIMGDCYYLRMTQMNIQELESHHQIRLHNELDQLRNTTVNQTTWQRWKTELK